ncbi:STAS domain-containing protein [Streptomyces sp. NPDC003327]
MEDEHPAGPDHGGPAPDGADRGARPPGAGRFAVEVAPASYPGTVVLSPSGELDHDTVGPFDEALDRHAEPGVRIVVDCSGLRFCDSTGLNALLRARTALLAVGGRLDLAGLLPPIERMFDITGARTVFRVYEDLGGALTDLTVPDDRP